MLTSRDDYLSLLYKIQDPNRQSTIIQLPPNEPIYDIDLNTRAVKAPKYLSVEYDHNAETIYFAVDRFYDNIDLSTMFCVIQYQNANPEKEKSGYIYPVPYFDITTKAKENKMLFQWAIEGPATAFSGIVTFAIKFYKISSITIDSVDGETVTKKVYDYVLNTQSAKSEVLHGLDVYATTENYYFSTEVIDEIFQAIQEAKDVRSQELCWIVLTDEDMIGKVDTDYPDKTINKNDIINNLITE